MCGPPGNRQCQVPVVTPSRIEEPRTVSAVAAPVSACRLTGAPGSQERRKRHRQRRREGPPAFAPESQGGDGTGSRNRLLPYLDSSYRRLSA